MRYCIKVEGRIYDDEASILSCRFFDEGQRLPYFPSRTYTDLYEVYIEILKRHKYTQPDDETCTREVLQAFGLDYDKMSFEEVDRFMFALPILYDGQEYAYKIESIYILDYENNTFRNIYDEVFN